MPNIFWLSKTLLSTWFLFYLYSNYFQMAVAFQLLRRHTNMKAFTTSPIQRNRMTHLSTISTGAYDHERIERKWQNYWDKHETFKAVRRNGFPKKYILDMFPYPSGSGLHVGHPEGYTATDIAARFWRMNGHDVLHPMGWDAFGLPAEQHAIATGQHPEITTLENIKTFKRQLKSLGFSYDWSRELSTTDSNYVRWTQWIFLQLMKRGLAYQSELYVNWCPALGTVLANEEVIDGLSERGNHPVVRKPVRQWVLRLTSYANELEKGLSGLQWPEGTITAQQQWIGKSEGVMIKFNISGISGDERSIVEVFTTRPETLYGVTFISLAPEHPLVKTLVDQSPLSTPLSNYVADALSKSDMDRATVSGKLKTGIPLGITAIHPLTGSEIPLWVADYVVGSYGTGAVMGVPAHDERDFSFAKKFKIPIIQVIKPSLENNDTDLPYLGVGVSCNSSENDGLNSEESAQRIVNRLIELQCGSRITVYKLKDWLFSRQRYWGEPIPIYFPIEFQESPGKSSEFFDPRKPECAHRICYETPIPVDEADLPLKLPDMVDFSPSGDPQGCLAKAIDWRYFQKEGKWFARETNTMPQWAGSCWYYLRFTDPKNESELIGVEGKSWLPVDLYVGGQEHAVLHLLYARFWHKVLFDMKLIDEPEPFTRLIHQGMILGSDGEKMSKSRGNVVNPDDVVQQVGADALRLYEMSMGPLEAVKPWQTVQVQGVVRFRNRVYAMVKEYAQLKPDHSVSKDTVFEDEIVKHMHRAIKKVTQDVQTLSYNTAISTMMIYSNDLSRALKQFGAKLPVQLIENLILLISPFAPHLAEECWETLGHSSSLALCPWPTYDEAMCTRAEINIAIQINGKFKGELSVPAGSIQEDIMSVVEKNFKKHLDGSTVKKIIFVPDKIINILISTASK